MKYFITESKNSVEKMELKRLGLYCYDVKKSIDGATASIEKNVVTDKICSIITDKSIYLPEVESRNIIDYNLFISENKQVNSLDELLISKIYLTTIKLDNDKNICSEFDFLFSDCDNYQEIDKLSPQEKKDYILDHYEDIGNYDLIDVGNQEYRLYRIDYSKMIEKFKIEREGR